MELDLERLPQACCHHYGWQRQVGQAKTEEPNFRTQKGRRRCALHRDLLPGIGHRLLDPLRLFKRKLEPASKRSKGALGVARKISQIRAPRTYPTNRYGSGISATMTASPHLLWSNFASLRIRRSDFDKLILSLALNYGGRQEITRGRQTFSGRCNEWYRSRPTLP